MVERKLAVVQVLPALESGGVERGTLDVGCELVRLGHRSIVVSADGRLVPELLAAGSEHVSWTVGRKSLLTTRYIPRMRRLLQQEHVDILHLRSRFPAWIAYLAWKSLPEQRRPALVTTVHGFYSVSRYSAVMTKGQCVIAVSASVRDYATTNYSVSSDRVRVIHRGVDRARYPYGFQPTSEWQAKWRREYPELEGRFVVTLPGRLSRWKGQEDFIALLGDLVSQGLPVHGLIVGGHDRRRAPYVDELRQRITAAGLGAHITMTGDRSDLREILAISDVVLSLSSHPEAFGRTTIEALSLGRPVCGYDHGGVGEQLASVLPEGRIAVGDLPALAARVSEWYQRPPVVARQHPFTLDRMLASTLDVYRSLARDLDWRARGSD